MQLPFKYFGCPGADGLLYLGLQLKPVMTTVLSEYIVYLSSICYEPISPIYCAAGDGTVYVILSAAEFHTGSPPNRHIYRRGPAQEPAP